MKKIITIAVAAFFLAVAMAYIAYRPSEGDRAHAQIASSSTIASSTVSFPSEISSSTLPDYLGSVSEVFDTFPTGPTLTIGTAVGTVQMNNFYAPDVPVNMVQDLVFKETEDYLMVYDPTDSSFWIAITGQPFATWQPVAEQDFLQTLGVSAGDACKLEVSEGVIYSEGDPNDGKSFPLTFCGAATSTF